MELWSEGWSQQPRLRDRNLWAWAPSEAQFIDMTLAMHAGGGHRRCVWQWPTSVLFSIHLSKLDTINDKTPFTNRRLKGRVGQWDVCFLMLTEIWRYCTLGCIVYTVYSVKGLHDFQFFFFCFFFEVDQIDRRKKFKKWTLKMSKLTAYVFL